MWCCGGLKQPSRSHATIVARYEALQATPLFSATAGDDKTTRVLMETIAEEATLLKVKAGEDIGSHPYGTFVVVVDGELKVTEARSGSSRHVNHTAPSTDDAVAIRRKGDLFRIAGVGGSSKLHRITSDLAQILATQKSVILVLQPDHLRRALSKASGRNSTAAPCHLSSILSEMVAQDVSTLIAKVPCFAPLNERLRHALAQLFSYDVLTPKATLFREGEPGETLCILLHGVSKLISRNLTKHAPSA